MRHRSPVDDDLLVDLDAEPRATARIVRELRRGLRPGLVLLTFAVAMVAVAALLLDRMGAALPGSSSYEVRVFVDEAKGVIPGQQEVRIAGVRVGRIKDVAVTRGGAVITASIDARYAPLRRDARLRLRPATPLGDLNLDIESRGHPRAGAVPAGGTITSERTRTPVDPSRVLAIFDPVTRTRMQALIDGFGEGLVDRGDDLRAALDALTPFLLAADRLTRELAMRRTTTRRLVHDVRRISDELSRRSRDLRGLIVEADGTFTSLAGVRPSLDATLEALPRTVEQLGTTSVALRGGLERLRPALDALQAPATRLAGALDALESLSDIATPALNRLRPAVNALRPATARLRPVVRDLDVSFARLSESAPALDRVTARVVPCEASIRRFFPWTASIFKFRDEIASFPRSEAVPGPLDYVRGPSCTEDGR